MKKLLALIILSVMIVCFIAPFFGAKKEEKTDVAAQEISTNYLFYSDIINLLHKNYKNLKEISRDISTTNISNTMTIKQFGWTTSNINIRKEPNVNCEILGLLNFNSYVEYYDENDEWVKIQHNGSDAYINRNYISNSECLYIEHDMPYNNGFKSFMPYTTITDKTSQQYKLQYQYAYTGDYGIREVDGRYCIAVGTAFDVSVGTYVDLILENGTVLQCIIGDYKDDEDTDYTNIITKDNGCVSEFIVDMSILDSNIINAGDMSAIAETWNSKVVSIKIYNKNILE